MKAGTASVRRIELRLREAGQLFNSMDPAPFPHKDLDPVAEEFIESWALEFPPDSRFHIHVHVERLPPDGDPTAMVTAAIHNFFDYKTELTRRELKQLMEQGRISLLIGLAFLVLCLLAADLIAKVAAGTFLNIVRESLTIGGWVAMWRPLQIFLYDWWPLVRRRNIYRSLGRAQVRVLGGAERAATMHEAPAAGASG